MVEEVSYIGAGLSGMDGKGRVTIPACLRETVEQSSGGERAVVIARHESLNCLVGFGRGERAKIREELDFEWRTAVAAGQPFDRDKRARDRVASMQEVNFEASGRFVMPPMLRHFGRLNDKAFFFGNVWNFWIWDPAVLAAQGSDFAQQKELLDYFLSQQDDKRK